MHIHWVNGNGTGSIQYNVYNWKTWFERELLVCVTRFVKGFVFCDVHCYFCIYSSSCLLPFTSADQRKPYLQKQALEHGPLAKKDFFFLCENIVALHTACAITRVYELLTLPVVLQFLHSSICSTQRLNVSQQTLLMSVYEWFLKPLLSQSHLCCGKPLEKSIKFVLSAC